MNNIVKVDTLEMVVNAMEENGYMIGHNFMVFEDHIGERLAVDADRGIVYRVKEDGGMIPFATADTSKKADGYLVAVFNYKTKDKNGKEVIKPYRIKQHILVGLVAHRKEFDEYMEDEIRPVCCHINSTPYDNRAENVEWGTVSLNNKQGKMGASIEHYYPGIYTEKEERAYAGRDGEDKVHSFIKVPQGIRNADIERYESLYGKLTIRRGEEACYYNLEVVDQFIDFMIDTGKWIGHREIEVDSI